MSSLKRLLTVEERDSTVLFIQEDPMLDVQNLFINPSRQHLFATQQEVSPRPPTYHAPDFLAPEDIRSSLRTLKSLTKIFSRELSFDYHEELNRVIVKVIDKNTDAVIKEIPPAEVHRMLLRIREAVGLIIDQLI